jgi:MSHA pilin protein MshD
MPRPSRSNLKPATFTERRPRSRERGLSLVELVMFIAIVGMSLAGVLVVYNQAVKGSADPMVRKQAVAIAESLLNEVLMQPFTWCDPQDAANDSDTAPSAGASCTGGAGNSQDKGGGALGPQPATESRFSTNNPFDNVADYAGYSMSSGIYSLADGATPVAGLSDYSASITVTRDGGTFGLASDAVLRVDVLVSGKGETITLTGYRFRHSPNSTG